jgi:sugar/nucleoside kinase (ribokinase family)
MAVDVLLLNTAVVDFRREDFYVTDDLVGEGGVVRCEAPDVPGFSQAQFQEWIDRGFAVPGGLGNAAPLIAAAGLRVAVGANLGRGNASGLDAQGNFFRNRMAACGIDTSALAAHPSLPTGTTFIGSSKACDRPGITYFSNANDDFDFEIFAAHVERLKPRIVYYMYSGLSKRGDANEGRDLAEFMRWCRSGGSVAIADCHTLAGKPQNLIHSAIPVAGYKLLEPLLPELDIFFTSSDESRLIQNTLFPPFRATESTDFSYSAFLAMLAKKYEGEGGRTRLLGVTVSDGAYEKHILPDGYSSVPAKITSKFMAGEVVDLVGAGDAFRAGLVSYIARNLAAFRSGEMDFSEAVQMGNLFASCYIKAPLGRRYAIESYEQMIRKVRGNPFSESKVQSANSRDSQADFKPDDIPL